MEYLIKGTLVFTPDPDTFTVLEKHYLHIRDGRILKILNNIPQELSSLKVDDYEDRLIIPGFTDLHLHAVQYVNRGIGMDMELLDWLNAYTFPEEAHFEQREYAEKVFKSFIRDLWKNGTLHSCVYSSIHKKSSEKLMDLFIESGLSAYVGKVNMDRNSSPELTEDTSDSVCSTLEWIKKYKDRSDLVKPIITPRFAPSCSPELLDELAQLADTYSLPVQSHLNENKKEIEWVANLFPEASNYLDAYEKHGLVKNSKTIMAHSIYNKDDETDAFVRESVFLAHCPTSNLNLSSGIMPVSSLLKRGNIKIGLGSDIAAGDTLFIPQVMRAAIQSSKILSLYDKDNEPLTLSQVFYLGTKGGGEFFGNTGSFEEGCYADLLILDDSENTQFRALSPIERLEKLIYTGDDRNITSRILRGNEVSCPFE